MKYFGIFFIGMLCIFCISKVYAFSKCIHVGKQQDYPPYIFEIDGKTVGVCAELAEEAFARLGIDVIYTQYPFPRMLMYGKTGGVDAVMLVFKTSNREAYLYYPEHALSYEENVFFTKKGVKISYSGNLEELNAYTVGVIRGFSYGDLFDHATFITRIEAIDDEMLLKLLLAGRYQVAVGCKSVISYHAEKMGVLDEITFLTPNLFDKNPLYIGFSKAKSENEELVIKFSEAIAELKKTGHYQRILEKYHLEWSDEGLSK